MIDCETHNQGGILHSTFELENWRVADLLKAIVKDINVWSWTKRSARFYNVRRMFTDLKTHYPGASNTDNIVDEAELMLRSTLYTGEKRNFTFEKYAQMHKDAHTMMK